jgi:8-oxo-dGTP pyrophosphatase MutT (NUDIX family)
MDYVKKDMICINCGYTGHTSKNCNFPITSFGIIAYHTHRNALRFLMVQRKDSLCYTEFIRGKYDVKNIGYISKLFTHMTVEEKQKLLRNEFDTVWQMLWVNNTNNLKKEFNISRTKYSKLKNGYKIKTRDGIINVDMQYFVDTTRSIQEPEWEFPKGRRKLNESDVACAMREFEEETSIHRKFIRLNDNCKQYEEIFIGKNKQRYRNVFYLASYVRNNLDDVFFDKDNYDQIKEIKDVQWMTYDQVSDKISMQIEKFELFRRIHSQIRKSKLL